MKKRKLDIALWLWNGLGMCVIIGFFVFSLAIGGSAGNGYVGGASHYVGDHGNYVLVSEQI